MAPTAQDPRFRLPGFTLPVDYTPNKEAPKAMFPGLFSVKYSSDEEWRVLFRNALDDDERDRGAIQLSILTHCSVVFS